MMFLHNKRKEYKILKKFVALTDDLNTVNIFWLFCIEVYISALRTIHSSLITPHVPEEKGLANKQDWQRRWYNDVRVLLFHVEASSNLAVLSRIQQHSSTILSAVISQIRYWRFPISCGEYFRFVIFPPAFRHEQSEHALYILYYNTTLHKHKRHASRP